MNTLVQYDTQLAHCKEIFRHKTKDYGTSWRVYRTISVVDQIYIKAWRIRQIQEGVVPRIADNVQNEFKAIVNYGIIGNILLHESIDNSEDLAYDTALSYYDKQADVIRKLMLDKNNDYGEAWRAMSQQSFIDLILTKLLRIKQILSNDGKTIVSEGIDANFADIVNYSLFALILIDEGSH